MPEHSTGSFSTSLPTAASELHPSSLTWVTLLGRWIEFAKASVALPADGEGRCWRGSIAPIISLQAVTFALSTLHELPTNERALGLDRAEILIRDNVGKLDEIWRGQPMSAMLLELMADARRALTIAERGVVLEFVLPSMIGEGAEGLDSSGRWEMPDCGPEVSSLAKGGFRGSVYLAGAGTLLVAGEPVGYVLIPVEVVMTAEIEGMIRKLGERLGRVEMIEGMGARQIYREFTNGETDGVKIVRDVVCELAGDPRAGQPLLLPVLESGEPMKFRVPNAGRWREQQIRAWPPLKDGFTVFFEAGEVE